MRFGGKKEEYEKDIFRPQGSLCVRVTYPIKQLLGGMRSHTSKYEYGNVGQSLCLCVCVRVPASGQTGGSALPRWSARIKGNVSALHGWQTLTLSHTHADTQLKMHTLGL